MYLNITNPCWPDDGRIMAETCGQKYIRLVEFTLILLFLVDLMMAG